MCNLCETLANVATKECHAEFSIISVSAALKTSSLGDLAERQWKKTSSRKDVKHGKIWWALLLVLLLL